MSMASSNEYYPWPSTLNISNFVSVKPWLKDKETSNNYKTWREQMLCVLESQDLVGFINGEIEIPECGDGSTSRSEPMKVDKHKLWRRTDRLVKGWILGSLGDDVLNALVGLNITSSSREVWNEVGNIFSQKKPVNAFRSKVLNSKSDDAIQEDRTVEVASDISTSVVDENGRGSSYFKAIVWTVMEHLVTTIKDIRHKKVLHKQAIELVKYLCQKLESWPGTEDSGIHRRSVIIAADYGIHEVVEFIAERFPLAIFVSSSSTGDNIMSLAVKNRHENVYNVIWQMNYLEDKLSRHMDSSRNNLMHMSAKLAPPHKLNLLPGAALQMQRELQWFKEMESIVKISRRTWKNQDGETPRTLFTKEHEDLKQRGEKWMRDTASSCSIAAALIATVVFAAAFKVPGGIDSNTGIPIFWDKIPFILFAIANIISLFTSVTSLLVFLAILTSRYAE